jgi:hypothetical protein
MSTYRMSIGECASLGTSRGGAHWQLICIPGAPQDIPPSSAPSNARPTVTSKRHGSVLRVHPVSEVPELGHSFLSPILLGLTGKDVRE